jgi:hypothetical protein
MIPLSTRFKQMNMTENWKKIEGYDYYEISDTGTIRSLEKQVYRSRFPTGRYIKKARILKAGLNTHGYPQIALTGNNGKRNWFQIHRLVATCFMTNTENKKTIKHKNGIKTDNRVENLEWMSQRENLLHSFRVLGRKPSKTGLGKTGAKNVKSKPVLCITNGKVYEGLSEAGRELNININNISAVCKGKRSHTCGYQFKYA